MVCTGLVHYEILQIHDLEILGHRVVERHRVSHIAGVWRIISAEPLFVGRTEICRGPCPVLLSQDRGVFAA